MKPPIGNRRKSILDYLQKSGGATKTQIVEATGLTKDQVRVLLFRLRADGEAIHDGKRNGTYSIGKLLERFVPQTKEEVAAKAREYQRAYLARQQKIKDKRSIKQTKTWKLEPQPEVTVTYPKGYVHTVCVSAKYEPLNLRAHV